MDVVVVPPVHVAEPEDQIGQVVTLGVGIDEGLAGDLAGRVRALGDHEVRLGLLGDVAVNVPIDLPRAAEDKRGPMAAGEFQDPETVRDILQGPVGVLDELKYLGVGGQMHDHVEVTGRPILLLHGQQILNQGIDLICPRVRANIDPHHLLAPGQQFQGQIRPDLPTRSGNQHAHGLYPFFTISNRRKVYLFIQAVATASR